MHKENITSKVEVKKQAVKYEIPNLTSNSKTNSTKKEISSTLGWPDSDNKGAMSLTSKISIGSPFFLFLFHILISYTSNKSIDYEEFFKTYYEKIERIEEGQKKCPELTSKEQIALEDIENQLLRHHTPWERSEDLSKIEQLPFASKIKELKAPHEATNYITDNINQEICSCIGKVIVQTDSIKYSLNLGKDREILRNNINNSSFIVDYPNLIYLNLSYVLVWGESKSLPPEILTLESLQTLVLEHDDIDFVPEEIDMLNNLKKLSLKDNKLTLAPNNITGLKNLTSLNLSQNNITTLPKTIRKNKALEELIVSDNSIRSIERFKKEEVPNIKTIDLRDNTISYWKKKTPSLNPKDKKRLEREFKKGIVKL